MLPFILLMRHQQNPFRDVKLASSEKIKGWGNGIILQPIKKHRENNKAK